MAIADKLTYLNATKLLLRDAIRRAGHYLPDAATFRAYPYALLPDESSLSLDFVRGEYVAHNWRDGTVSRAGLSSIMTTTRASGGGYFDHLGVYQWAANNTPRIDHDPATLSTSTTSATLAAGAVTLAVTVAYPVGSYVRATHDGSNWMAGRVTASTGSSVTLWVDRVVGSGTYASWTLIRKLGLLVEESRTNLLLQSQSMTSSPWIKVGAVVVTENAGIAPDGLATATRVRSSVAGFNAINQELSVTSGASYTASAWVRSADGGSHNMRIWTDATGVTSTSVATFTATPEWTRVSVSSTAPDANSRFQIGPSITGNTYDVLVWGAQLEAGAFPTSHIPTTTAQVTRAADQCVVSNLADWYRGDEGTIVAEAVRYQLINSAVYELTLDGANRVWNRSNSLGTGEQIVVTDGGVTQALFTPAAALNHRSALAVKANAFAASLNGAAPLTDNSGTVPSGMTTLRLGLSDVTRYLNGHIESLQYIPRALSNTELQRITA